MQTADFLPVNPAETLTSFGRGSKCALGFQDSDEKAIKSAVRQEI
jgi:hypothetical protein